MTILTDSFENALQLLLFNNTAIAGIGDASGILGSAVAGSLYVSAHTADPGEGGNQSTNEATFTGYARVPVVRAPAGWTVAASNVVNAANVEFPENTGALQQITHLGIGVSLAGANLLLKKIALTAARDVDTNDVLRFPAGQISSTAD